MAMMRWWSSFATAKKELVRNKGGNHQDNCTSFAHVVFGDLQAPSMGFLLESLSMLCSCVPLIDKQAIEDPIHITVMKPIRLTDNPLLSKAESLGDCAAARVVCRTRHLDFMHLILHARVPHHRPTS